MVTESSGEAEVDEFDLAASFVDTHDVLRFEVEVDDALFVDEADAIDDLQHVFDHLPFCQLKVLVDDPLKQLATWDPAQQKHLVAMTTQSTTEKKCNAPNTIHMKTLSVSLRLHDEAVGSIETEQKNVVMLDAQALSKWKNVM